MTLVGFRSISLPLVQLSLEAVLKCGQSFRWSILAAPFSENGLSKGKPDELPPHERVEYRLCLRDRVVCLRQSSDALYYRSVFPDPQPSPTVLLVREAETLEWLKDYFQLDIDLASLYQEWSAKDKIFAKFQDRFGGIRILRQDPWENLVSFICSSNNNISRITKMVQNICTHYSAPLLSIEHPFSPSESIAYHPFPPPSALAGSGIGLHLRSLGFGYRAEFIQRTAKMLVETHGTGSSEQSSSAEGPELWLQGLRKQSTAQARAELLKFVGVGRKVADCILLMSLDKKEVVPVDTHVYQIAVKHYGTKAPSGGKASMTAKLYEDLSSKFFSIWGDYAGWAHTVLFTADLKSFSSYGLPVASPLQSPAPTPRKNRRGQKSEAEIPTQLITPGDSPLKRRLDIEVETIEPLSPGISKLCEETADYMNLVDRVKKRRRNV